jgi:archaellum component FlaC
MNASGSDGTARTDGGEIAVREGGVEVVKSYESERFPVPAMLFRIRSEREEPVEVRLADWVPEEVSMDDIGFHPEYGSEFWSVEGHTLVFERELPAGEDAETVYGLRGPDAENPELFLDDPAIEVRAGRDGGGRLLGEANDPLVRSPTPEGNGEDAGPADESAVEEGLEPSNEDASGTDDPDGPSTGTTVPDEGETGADDRDDSGNNDQGGIESAEGSDAAPTEDGTMDDDTTTETDRTDDGTAETNTAETDTADTATAGPESDEADEPIDDIGTDEAGEFGYPGDGRENTLAATLARELRAGRVEEDDRETLRDVLGPRDSVTVRIDRLQSRVEEIAAYADALESFIDENGSARQLVRRQTERTETLAEDVEAVGEEASTNRADVERIDDEVEAIDDEVGTVERDVEAFREAIADLDEEIERVDDRFENVEERFGGIENRLDALDDRVGNSDAAREADLDELREALETRMDERVSSTEESIESVSADVAALESWRSQLSAVISGAGGTGADAESDSDTDTRT